MISLTIGLSYYWFHLLKDCHPIRTVHATVNKPPTQNLFCLPYAVHVTAIKWPTHQIFYIFCMQYTRQLFSDLPTTRDFYWGAIARSQLEVITVGAIRFRMVYGIQILNGVQISNGQPFFSLGRFMLKGSWSFNVKNLGYQSSDFEWSGPFKNWTLRNPTFKTFNNRMSFG